MSAYVYRAFDDDGRLLYIGSTIQPGRRFRDHARRTPWFGLVREFRWTYYRQEQDARSAELVAILLEHPFFNVEGRSPLHPMGRSRRRPRRPSAASLANLTRHRSPA